MPKQKPTEQDIADRIGMDMLAPARAVAARIGVHEFTAQLCAKLGLAVVPSRVGQMRQWLSTDPARWRHPRAGVVKLMLKIK